LIPVDPKKRLYYQYLGFLNTQALFTHSLQSLTQFVIPTVEIPPYEDFNLNIPEKLPLGKRIEYFFEYFIQRSSEYEIIKNNVQIIHNKLTLGELDYIIQSNTTQQQYHIELIFKYYLYLEHIENEVQRLIGPNFDDSLEKRIEKINRKQLPLLFKEETKVYLEKINTDNITQQVCFKGNIFMPHNSSSLLFDKINDSCIQGSYIRAEEFLINPHFRNFTYFFPEKQDWLINLKYCKFWFSYEEIVDQLQVMLDQKRAPLLWQKKDENYNSLFLTF